MHMCMCMCTWQVRLFRAALRLPKYAGLGLAPDTTPVDMALLAWSQRRPGDAAGRSPGAGLLGLALSAAGCAARLGGRAGPPRRQSMGRLRRDPEARLKLPMCPLPLPLAQVLSCPPYFDLEQYGGGDGDLSMMSSCAA